MRAALRFDIWGNDVTACPDQWHAADIIRREVPSAERRWRILHCDTGLPRKRQKEYGHAREPRAQTDPPVQDGEQLALWED